MPQAALALADPHPAVALLAREMRVRRGKVPRSIGGQQVVRDQFYLAGDSYLMRADDGIAVHYRLGEGLTLEAPEDADPRDVALWLNGSVYAAVAALNGLGASEAVDWVQLRAEAEAQGWLRGADLLLALTARWFAPLPVAFAPPPEAVLAAAEDALLPDPAARGHGEAAADFAAARSPAALARALRRRLTPDPHVVEAVGGGRPAWAFWPIWAARRLARLGRRVGDRRVSAEARSAAQVMRWLQG